jgi:sulfite dehydrogenase (cytochrome) subunit B
VRPILAAVTAVTLATPSQAVEKIVHLRLGEGLDKVEAHCGGCHSLDYVPMNSPFLDAAAWEAEVTKMISVYGAPIEKADAKIISDYLITNYGRKPSSPSRPPTSKTQKPQADGLFPPLLQNDAGQRKGFAPKSE